MAADEERGRVHHLSEAVTNLNRLPRVCELNEQKPHRSRVSFLLIVCVVNRLFRYR